MINEEQPRLPAFDVTWRRWAFALTFGLVAALSLPPAINSFPAWAWFGFSTLVALNLTAKSAREAAIEGWIFGLGWFGYGLHWVGHAFLVDADRYAMLMPFAVFGLAAACALYIAAQSAVVSVLIRRFRVRWFLIPVVFAAVWTLGEWLRGQLFTGFPWNPLASVWVDTLPVLQSVSVIGTLGLSFLSALAFTFPVVLWTYDRTSRRKWLLICLPAIVLMAVYEMGDRRLEDATTTTHDDVVLRLVQPSIPQQDKWKGDLRQGHVIRQMALSRRTSGPAGAPTHVIWAETNVPFLIDPESPVTAALAAAVPAGGHLLFGAPRRNEEGNVYNSLLSVDDTGRIGITYDKFHLVPFGEYVPFRSILPFERLTEGRGDFAAGPGNVTQRLPGLPAFSAVICYEVIFPGRVVDGDDRPEWILNITNDAWFGPAAGPRQHFLQARLRAIEEGLPLVRVANNGISGVIDAHGRVRNSLDLNEQGLLDAPLPVALPPTVFARYGEIPVLVMALIALLACLRAQSRQSGTE